MSVVFNNTIVSIVSLLLLWYVAGYIFAFAGAEYMSPASLTRSLPQILRDTNAPKVVACSATRTSLSVRFSKDLDPNMAEQVANYNVVTHQSPRNAPDVAVYNKPDHSVVLSGLQLRRGEPVSVEVQGVTDLAGNVISPAADSARTHVVGRKSVEADSDRDRKSSTVRSKRRHSTHGRSLEPESQTPSSRGASASSGSNAGDTVAPWVTRVSATRSSASIAFSQDMDSAEAEKIDQYTIESPPGTTHTPRTAVYNPSTRTVLFSGLSFRSGDPVKVTAKGVTNLDGKTVNPRRNSAMFKEVDNWKFFAGFGVPALLFTILGVVWFSKRDL
jgi:hypothetical protein